MMHLKSVPVLDPHSVRNQCKLIWDSSTHTPRKPAKKKVGFADQSVRNVVQMRSKQASNDSLVANRISYFEDKREVICTPGEPDLQVINFSMNHLVRLCLHGKTSV